jgi:hypothetical protein
MAGTSAFKKLMKTISPLVERGDYKTSLEHVKKALRDEPNDFYLRYQYAKILGDWADELPTSRKRRYKTESIAILKTLIPHLRGKDVTTRWRLPLNYYYQSENWKGMFEFGQRFARSDRRLANYTKGLGAAYLAEASPAKSRARKTWSWRAIRAWTAYDLSKEKYYFAHYVFAKALALNGQTDGALKRLKTAARLGKRPVSDWEFSDVLKLCESELRAEKR